MNNFKNSKLIFLIISILFSFLIILNYTVKNPNDGVLYLSSAFYFVENNLLIDTTRSMDGIIRPFPTTQIGITFFLILLINLFKNFWIFAYIILLSLVWTILLKKLYYFSKNNFFENKYLSLILPFLIFFNYDYLIASSSFYNEALYYPFLIFGFLKIINYIKKNKSFFEKSFLFLTFLATGSIFRVQHIVFIAALGIFFLLYKKYKEFFVISVFGLINVFIFIITLDFLQMKENGIELLPQINNELNLLAEKNLLTHFYTYLRIYFTEVYNAIIYNEFSNYNLIFKNIKTHLTSYTNFFNLPKIVDITLANNGKSVSEFFYLLITFVVMFNLLKYFKNTKIDETKLFLIIYFIFNSIFLFFMTDLISRYFLYINFCVIFFLSDHFKFYKFNNNHKKYYFSAIFIFFLIITIYGFGYFKDYAIGNKSPTFRILNILKKFEHNRDSLFLKDEIFISRFNYHIKWVTDQASLNPQQYIYFHKKYNPKRKYFFVGTKNEFYNTNLPSIEPKVEYIENYLFNEVESDQISIWKIHLNTQK